MGVNCSWLPEVKTEKTDPTGQVDDFPNFQAGIPLNDKPSQSDFNFTEEEMAQAPEAYN